VHAFSSLPCVGAMCGASSCCPLLPTRHSTRACLMARVAFWVRVGVSLLHLVQQGCPPAAPGFVAPPPGRPFEQPSPPIKHSWSQQVQGHSLPTTCRPCTAVLLAHRALADPRSSLLLRTAAPPTVVRHQGGLRRRGPQPANHQARGDGSGEDERVLLMKCCS